MLFLLKAGADAESVDDVGLTPVFYALRLLLLEPFKILGKTGCVLNSFVNRYDSTPNTTGTRSSLEYTMISVPFKRHQWYRDDAFIDVAGAKADAIIRLVAERHRRLRAFTQTLLDAQAALRLRLSTETFLYYRA